MTTTPHGLLAWSLEAVVFDCDGTLMDSERHWQEARSRAFLEMNPRFGFAEQATGLHYEDCGRLMARTVNKPELAEDLTAALLDHFLALVTDDPATMPGAVQLVRLLSGRLPLAVASNCPRVVVEGSLERAGLRAHFQHIVVPDTGDGVRPKPHPDTYAVAARLCGVRPHRALAIEDSLTVWSGPPRWTAGSWRRPQAAGRRRHSGRPMVTGAACPRTADLGPILRYSEAVAGILVRCWMRTTMPPSATPASRSAPPKASMPPPAQAMNCSRQRADSGHADDHSDYTTLFGPHLRRTGHARAVKTDRLHHRVLCPSEAISS